MLHASPMLHALFFMLIKNQGLLMFRSRTSAEKHKLQIITKQSLQPNWETFYHAQTEASTENRFSSRGCFLRSGKPTLCPT
mmetsp:Transcript_60456/g.118493  ORF Transcript_60456/g.118493 Transcript_60456/m.118493 type:complete len:81 (-) Transcript_60456:672-914(-)